MRLSLWAVRRTAFAVVGVYLVMSVMFCAVAFFQPPDPPNAPAPPEGSPQDGDTPLLDRYVTWLVKFTTFDWSYGSGSTGVLDTVVERLTLTATYLSPALAFAYLGGLVIGIRSALDADGLLNRAERTVAYLGFAAPTFFVAVVVLYLLTDQGGWLYPYYEPERDLLSTYNLVRIAPAAGVMALGMVAVQLRHAYSESSKYVGQDFVKLLRAQGAGTWTVARHVMRNALATMLSLFFADLLGIVLLSVIAVEVVFQLPGFGNLLLGAAGSRDPGLVMGVTVATVLVGIGGHLLGDFVAVAVDPRVRDDLR